MFIADVPKNLWGGEQRVPLEYPGLRQVSEQLSVFCPGGRAQGLIPSVQEEKLRGQQSAPFVLCCPSGYAAEPGSPT